MIPLKDNLPSRGFPLVTFALVAANIAIFMYEISLGPHMDRIFFAYGAIPFELMQGIAAKERPIPIGLTAFTSMFVHGGFFHVGGNMLYLWIFGNNVEDAMGHGRFIVFYLLCGLIAVYSQAYIAPNSKLPMVGASGAVSGVLGAYLLLFPRAKVLTLVPFFIFIQIFRVPAVFLLGFWIVVQVLSGFFGDQSGVAWFAHIGGFIAGMLLIFFFIKPRARRRRFSS